MFAIKVDRTLLTRVKPIFFLVLLTLFAHRVYGQRNDCFYDKANDRTVCSISEPRPRPLTAVSVPNDKSVVIQIKDKSPFDDCLLGEIKLTDIKEADPIATILQLFTQAATGAKLASAVPADAKVNPKEDPLARNLYLITRDLETKSANEIDRSKTTIDKELKPLVKEVGAFIANPPRNNSDFTARIGDLIERLEVYEDHKPETLVYYQARYNSIHEQVKMISDPLAADILSHLDYVATQLDQLKDNYEAMNTSYSLLKTVHATLKDTRDAITQGKNPFIKDLPLLPYTQQLASTSVTCSSIITKKPTTQPIPIALSYQSKPRLSVSVGPLLSTTAKQKLGTTPISTGSGSFKSVFAVVDHAGVQIIPFAFLNYRIAEFGGNGSSLSRPFSFNFSAGIGVNPNSGTNEVEYFIGPSIGFKKKFFVQFGDHIGRFQKEFSGGFNIGDTVPASFPASLPIRKVYKHGFGAAISYKLPL